MAQRYVHKLLTRRSVVGYGLGDFANNLAFSLSTSFLLYYYTDVAGLSAAAVSTMFFVVRLWDAFADMIAGRLVDRSMTRWGKFRPFILFGAVPLLFLSFLTFQVPSSFDMGAKLLYAYLTYAVLGLVYSLVNIPYGALASAMTQSVKERAKLVAARFFGAATGGIVLTYLIAPQISDLKTQRNTLSPAEYQAQVQAIFTQSTLIFIVVGTIAYLLTFFWCREQVVRTQPRVSVRETWETLRHNTPLGFLCSASFFYLIGLFAVGGASAYYAQYVMGDITWMGPIVLVNSGISIVAAPFIPAAVEKWGKKALFQWCGLFTIVGGVALYLTPGGAVAPALVFLGVKGVGAALINTVMFGLEADTVEYGEWKSGKRSEGATYAIFSFTRKITQSLGGALGAAALAFGGYLSATAAVPNPVQPESAVTAIRVTMGLIPAVAALVAMVIFWKYPLTDQRFREIRDETEASKAAQGHAFAPDRLRRSTGID
ncbi:MAG: glycoside-pentoside-hexuronide (GPH):cation symporter [Intrasporangium sp.]|uniref:glycoside-pentoside-hexuronide (GPH):cation symporter n=1 Tax=Intrasporangium sp. TaxID=1925024 RepID=UPI0026485787|nr:glycoside-pentoside-hexuronide (GPH):cation symporter [Intrasporangium sp.]MDN5797968.1 glycoside-pentoside-hexuronide (GPH):cation symporter [Intrasporangium sp.]